ncbi:related to integral membrane protein [Fusarium torulosum]|uniref:Related to integral membrane protein n=1 Tax=Fusarium torulosum TaxID=33205 RepID=A0AAE8SFE1_9HYPO|nr:related to integral membrane protein [Fusarium torulosum]
MKCLIGTVVQPAFSNATQEQLCHDSDFTVAMGGCLQENCSARETLKVVNISATQCDLPIRNDGPTLRILSFTVFSLAIASFVMRLISKYLERSYWGFDDSFMVLAVVFLVPHVTLMQYMIHDGVGRDVWTLSEKEIVSSFKFFFFQQLDYFLILGLVKASVLAFYLRIFPDHKFRIVVSVTQAFNLISTAVCLVLMLTIRKPISVNWNGWADIFPRVKIRSQKILFACHSIMNIALDVWMVILPLTQIYQLGLKLRKKAGVIAMFSVDIFLTVACIMRFYFLMSFQSGKQGTESDAVKAIMWAFIELCVGVMVGCMPNIRQLTRRIWKVVLVQAKADEQNSERSSGIFIRRSLEPISDATTAVDEEKAKKGLSCNRS